jgi:hypothetical protein
MGKSLIGPDMLDCADLMRAIENLHGVSVSLDIQLTGDTYGGTVTICALAVVKVASGMALKRSVSRRHRWPNSDSKTFEGACFKLLHELDRDCGQTFWTQSELPL